MVGIILELVEVCISSHSYDDFHAHEKDKG
jgi:hypothetical protein